MDDTAQLRDVAIKRITAKREFWGHVLTYVLVNLLLVAIWALSGRGYFWPGWSMAGWGIGLAFHAWSVYFERPISEEAIRREMARMSRQP